MVLNGVLSVFLQLSPVISSNQYTRVIGLYRSTFVSTIVHQTRLWLWRRWFELVFELLASHAPWIWAGIWPMPRVNISKKCEKPWFSQENHLQMVHFPGLSFQEGTLL